MSDLTEMEVAEIEARQDVADIPRLLWALPGTWHERPDGLWALRIETTP